MSRGGRDALGRAAEGSFLLGVVLLGFQWVPPMPLPGMQLSDAIFAVAVGLLALARPSLRLPRSLAVAWVLFLGGAGLSAALQGGIPAKLLGHVELACLLLAALAIGRDAPGAARIQRALVLACVLAAASGVLGVALGLADRTTELVQVPGDLLPGPLPRVRGTMVRANQLASFLGVGTLLLIADPGLLRSRGLRRAAWAILAIAFVFTFSRSLLIAGVAAIALGASRRRTRVALTLAAVATAGLVALLLASARWELLMDPAEPWNATLTGEPASRWGFWTDAASTIRAHPLFGIGPGRAAAGVWTSHNAWINVWALLGLGPLLAFGWLLLRPLAPHGWRARPGPTAALFGVALTSLVLDVEDLRHLWIVLGLCWASFAPGDGSANGAEAEAPTPSTVAAG